MYFLIFSFSFKDSNGIRFSAVSDLYSSVCSSTRISYLKDSQLLIDDDCNSVITTRLGHTSTNTTSLNSSILDSSTSPYSSHFASRLNSTVSDLTELLSSNDDSSSEPNSPIKMKNFEDESKMLL